MRQKKKEQSNTDLAINNQQARAYIRVIRRENRLLAVIKKKIRTVRKTTKFI